MFYQAFLSTLSLRRATVKIGIDFIDGINFYPRSPCGERHHYLIPKIGTLHFYPRSPCGERRQIKQTCRAETSISIHALLAESDVLNPLETLIILIFLSTLSLRRATHWSGVPLVGRAISIHALLAESDVSSLPFGAVWIISIHALLAESDNTSIAGRITSNDFYPRSPCGERLRHSLIEFGKLRFLSTLSLRRATMDTLIFTNAVLFLSTLSLRRATSFALPRA